MQKYLYKFVFTFFIFGLSQSISAQNNCNHLTIDYNVSPSYYALGVNNLSEEDSEFFIEINEVNYLLDSLKFNKPRGNKLSIETIVNTNGTYNHILTSSKPIRGYQYLNFVYDGVPNSSNNNFSGNANVDCTYDYVAFGQNLVFNFFNEEQNYLGFSVQNNNSIPYYPYEIHIDNATYQLDPLQLNHNGFDFIAIDNGDGTYDYFFVAQDPIQAYSSAPTVSTNQNLGPNPNSAFNTILYGSNIVSSGINGGLESHGGLASKIALRNFKRAIGKSSSLELRTDNTIISEFAPQHIISGDQRIESSPTDLVNITAAEKIWAGDYYINGNRFASVFGSKTSEEIYDHTKVTCDRVKGSELAAVELVNIDGYETILTIIRRPNNTIEYAISFSLAYKDFGEFTMASNWAIDEYQSSPNFINYQVWTNSKAKSIAAVQVIIDNVITQNGHILNQAENSPRVPELFARQAHYKLGSFYIELNNRITESTTIQISGTCTSKEVEGTVIPFEKEIEIVPGQTTLKIDLPFGNIFDGEISLRTADNQKDLIYLADGSWGLEYDPSSTTIHQMEIISDDRTESTDEYIVERGISLSGSTDSYISIFKQLVPGGMPVDLSEYNTLSFDSEREGIYEVTLLTVENTDEVQNFIYTLNSGEESSINIPFALFSNADGDILDPSKITTIYLAFKEDNNNRNDFNISIENIHFNYNEDSNIIFNNDTNSQKLKLYPNPSNGIVQFTHMFSEKTDVQINIFDAKGAFVRNISTSAYEGLQNFELQFSDNEQGIYIISLQTNEGLYSNTFLLRK